MQRTKSGIRKPINKNQLPAAKERGCAIRRGLSDQAIEMRGIILKVKWEETKIV